MDKRHFRVDGGNEGERVDKYLAAVNEGLSRTYLQKLIDRGLVLVNGREIKNSRELTAGDKIELILPPPEEPSIPAAEMELNIIYEDNDIIVINKPPGLIVHPVPGNREHTLVNGLLAYTDNLSGIAGVRRPGIVHRLDKDTSGAIVVARNDSSHRSLINQFKQRQVEKIYHTIVRGKLPYKEGTIDAPIGRDPDNRTRMAVVEKNSKQAISLFRVVNYLDGYTYLEIRLKTGRTHQIRVHLSHFGYPVVGDDKYGSEEGISGVERQLLHARKLGFEHPGTGEWREFTAPVPEDFKEFVATYRESNN